MQEKTLGNYQIGQTLGEGTFGKVKMGMHTQTGEKVAIKILEKDKIQDNSDVNRIAKEIEILKKLRHPNIIMLYEIIETEKELYLIMEYANGGELFDYIVKNQRINEKQACKFLLQILSGVEYVHKIGVVHRDLKPENLLLDQNSNIKIVDFGLSNTYKPNELLKTACGSPCYAAPEMIQGQKYNGYLVDIWSCGIILFAMICGYLPFEDSNTNQLYKKIIAGELQIPQQISLEGKDLLKRILNTDPKKRYTIPQIRNHIWCRQIKIEEMHGIIVGQDPIPVDEVLLEQLKIQFNQDVGILRKMVIRNRHNPQTTLYYLQKQKIRRNRNFTYFKKDEQQSDQKENSLDKSHDMNTTFIQDSNKNRMSPIPQKKYSHHVTNHTNNNERSESPKIIKIPLRREHIRRPVIKHVIPPVQLKPIIQAVNNSISSVGTNTSVTTPIGTHRKTDESVSVEKIKIQPMGRDRAISAASEYKPKPILKIHRGAFNLKCTTNRDPDLMMEDIRLLLHQMNIKVVEKQKYEISCQHNINQRFEMAIRQLQNVDNIYLVKGHFISGEYDIYYQTLNKLLLQLKF